MQHTYRFLILVLLAFVSCKEKKQPLFIEIKSEQSGITFNNAIQEDEMLNMINYQYLYNGGGVGIGDFNNDSLTDIYFTSSIQSNRLYLNRGHMKFEDVTDKANVGGEKKWCRGATIVDINNDGLLDIYVCAAAWQTPELKRDILYVNKGIDQSTGIPSFKESATEYGFADTVSTHMTAFFDYDNDGDLDMYMVVNDLNQEFPNTFRRIRTDGTGFTTDKLFRNDWNAQLQHPVFTDVSKEAGISWEGNGLGISILDINQDGWKDIYISNDYLSGNILYVNNKNGTFTNRNSEYFKHGSLNAMGNDAGDINNDGLTDLVEMDMMPEDNYRQKMMMNPVDYNWYLNSSQYRFPYQTVRNTLQLNQGPRVLENDTIGPPVFSEIAYYAGVSNTDWSWAALLADVDNDGYKDLMTTNGLPKDITDLDFIAYRQYGQATSINELVQKLPPVQISNYIFHNNKNLTFTDKTNDWGWNFPTFSAGIAYADFDRDGDLDVVINNTNMEATLLENQLNKSKEKKNYLRIQFRGDTSNINGIGTIARIYYKGGQQVAEHTPYHGYMSSIENIMHFGLDSIDMIDSLVVLWPDGKKEVLLNVLCNQTMLISQSSTAINNPAQQSIIATSNWLTNITTKAGIDFLNEEYDYVDFNIQRQLPHKYSQNGPVLAAADINKDSLVDIIVGGCSPEPAFIYLQQPNKTFIKKSLAADFKQFTDDGGLCLFDADNDEDPDLYITSGGNELMKGVKGYADRLYINDGMGNFNYDSLAIPINYASKSVVKAADFDNDGDLDLFVGGRMVPGEYPKPENGYLLRNDSKNGTIKFNLVTKELAPELISIGMITDASWNDVDKDGDADLIITGEWMGIYFFKNEKGKLVKQTTSTDNLKGWWNCLNAADLDKDGDVDFVVGNYGTNGYYNGTEKEPVTVYAKDYGGNNQWDALLSIWKPATLHGPRKEFPVAYRDQLADEIPSIKKQFPDYISYAKADMKTVMSGFNRTNEIQLKATLFKTGWIENKGNFQFKFHPLPAQAQFAPVFGIVVNDFNADGNPDIILSGNEYGMHPYLGRYDALNGLVLQGDGKGNFTPLSILQSGFFIPGNAKALIQFTYNNSIAIAATQNSGPLKLFQIKK
jgi:enediyne biosynthesis protein E4